MSKSSRILIICLLVLIFLAVTNPSQENFIDWILEQENNSSELEALFDEVIGRTILRATTDRENYVVFSVFTVQEAGEEIKYIGFLRRIFFQL